MQDLYEENYKPQKIKIKECLNRWRNRSWIVRIHTVKMPVLASLVNCVDEIPTEILANNFLNNEKLILKFSKMTKPPGQLAVHYRRTDILEESHYMTLRLTVKLR